MITIGSVVPANLTICGESKLFTLNIYNPSPFLITADTLFITLPTGVQFDGNYPVPGFINDFGGIVKIALTNIPTLTSRTITFKANAQCNVLQFISGGGIIRNNVRVNYTANNMQQYDAINTSIYLIKQPNITITSITNQSYVGNIGDVFTRCITIINGGFGELSGFTLTDVHAAGIQINSVNKGTLTHLGLTSKIVIGPSDFAGIGNGNNVFEGGESIIICETVTVLNCISASSAFKAFWGCSVNYCQATVSTANVVFPNYVPNLSITPTATLNSCIGTGNASLQQLRVINTGLGQAVNVSLHIFQATGTGYNPNTGSNIDPSSFTIQVGISSAAVPIVPTTTQATNNVGCMTGAKGRAILSIPYINAGDTVYIKWNSYSCCFNKCTNTGKDVINGWRYKGSYASVCQSTYVIYENWGRIYSRIYGNLTPDGAPSTLSNGQTGTFTFLFSNYANSYPAGPGAHWKFKFYVPSFPCLSYSNIRIIHNNGVTTWNPTSVTALGDTVTAIFNGSAPFNLTQAELKINLALVCGSCTGTEVLTNISVKSYYIPNNTCGCEVGVSCQNIPFNINCPDPCPAGIMFNNFEMQRVSYGLPDNEAGGGNGIPDGSGSLNFSKIKTNRAMFSDTISSFFYGVVNTNFANPTLQYCYATSSISNGNLLSFLDAELLIYRGGSVIATCNNFTPVITTTGTTRLFSYDLSVPTLISSGCLPGGYINTQNDSLVFNPRYRVSTNIGNVTPLNCYATNKFYLTNIENPTLTSDKLQCGNINGNFTAIGYFFHNDGGNNHGVKSCNNTVISQDYYMSIGPAWTNDAGGNLFPFEYRNWAHIQTLTAVIPTGYDFISARFKQVRTAGTLATSSSAWQSLIPSPNPPVSDTLVFDVDSYFPGTIPISDDGFNGRFEVTIQPSCEVVPGIDLPISHNMTFSAETALTGPGSDTTFLSQTDNFIVYDPPLLFLQSPLPSILALDSIETWDIIISNTSNVSHALNTWLSGPVISGVTIIQVVDLGTNLPITPIGEVYPVGTVSAMATRTFRVFAKFTSCNTDSVIVHCGWNCLDGYPDSVSLYPCIPERIALTLTPLMPGLIADITGPSSAILLCDTASFFVTGANAQLGTAHHVKLTATLPVGETIMTGTSKISYPISNPYVVIADPVLISGTTWQWDISAADTAIGSNGLSGILDTSINSYQLTFKVSTSCGFISGSNIDFTFTGQAPCGQNTEPEIFPSPGLDIIGATNPYITAVKITTTYVSPCAGNSTLRIVVYNNGPTAFGSTDSVLVKLPIGVPFVAGSFIGVYNAPGNGVPTQFTLNGISHLIWKLPPGVVAGDSSIFTFEYIGEPSFLACGIIFFEAKTYSVSTVVCISTGNTCLTNIITGDTSLAVFTYKAYLYLSNGEGTSVPNPPGGETVTLSYDIANTGQAILTDADSIVQFYFDANGNGIYDVSDVFLYADTLIIPKDSTMRFYSTFDVPAGQACSIIAYIDPFVNSCVCNPSELLIQPTLISLSSDTALCSGQTLVLNTPPVTGYVYSWSPITDLSDASTADPLLTALNLTTNPVLTTYILTTDRMGCVSEDTLTVTVNPPPIATLSGIIEVCGGSAAPDITFTGSNGTKPYTFTYTINGGSSQTIVTTNGDSVKLSAPTTVAGTFVYNLISIGDSVSCSSPKNDSVTVTVNPLPTATIEGTTAICVGDPAATIIFRGALGTAPYTFTYTINGGTSQTITTIAGDSAAITASSAIAGLFTYDIVSVTDSSTTICSQPQSGSAGITVNPLPTAAITGATAVCKDAPTPFVTFSGANGTGPYTITYTVNGGTNQTITTTGAGFINLPVPTGTDGTFIYALVSVMDSSSTTCSQPQTGSVTVTVDPLPTATIGGTDTVCQGSTASPVTFTGYGGVAPYTFIYTLDGVTQPAIVTVNGDSIVLNATTAAVGTFIYVLVSVQDANLAACTHPQTGDATITVNAKPLADFSSVKVCNGNATQFTDNSSTSSGTIISYSWDMDDGSPLTTAQNPFYIYSAAGIYNVTLMINNSMGCADTAIKTAQVYFNPIAGFNHNDVCFGDTIHFSNTSSIDSTSSIASYLWVFGDGSATNNLQDPSHYYSAPGTNNVTLVTTSINGCAAVANILVKTFDPPVTGFTFNNTCLFDSVLFTNTSVDPAMGTIAGWSWNFGDNSPTNTVSWNPGHLYAAPGNYQLTLITFSSNLGCPDTLQDSITIFPMPAANFGTAPVCLNQAMDFYDSSNVSVGTVTGWSWDFGDNTPTGNTQNPSHTYTGAATYSVSLIATSSNGCKDTSVKSVVVHPLPAVQFATVNVCDGNVVFFTDLSTISATDTIQYHTWDYGDNSLPGTSQNTSHLYAAAGAYAVQLVAVSYFGCADSITKTSIVNPNPAVLFTANDTAGCEPFCISFQDLSSILTGSNIAWQWNFGDGSPTTTLEIPGHCYFNDSVFLPISYTPSLTVTSDSGCFSTSSLNNYITVYPKPEADFTVEPAATTIINPVISVTDVSAGAIIWNWNFGDGSAPLTTSLDSSQINPPPYVYADTGTYSIMLITNTQYGCLDSAYQTISIEPDFVFYIPNAFTPDDDGINDSFSGKGIFIIKYEMSIFDRWGNLLFFSDDINKPWEGKANHGDKLAQRDVYVYSIKVTDIKMGEHAYKGIVTLVR